MVAIEPLTGARIPEQSDGPLGGLQTGNAVKDLASFSVPRFATLSERDAKYAAFVVAGGVIKNGMICWADTPGCFYDRIGGVWKPRADVVYNTTALDNTAVPATARIVRVATSSIVTVSNAGGGFQVPFGFSFTKLMSVRLAPGDRIGPLGFVVPVPENHTIASAGGVAYQPGGAVVPNGQNIRVEVDAIGYVL